jgi:hypothetical protein
MGNGVPLTPNPRIWSGAEHQRRKAVRADFARWYFAKPAGSGSLMTRSATAWERQIADADGIMARLAKLRR